MKSVHSFHFLPVRDHVGKLLFLNKWYVVEPQYHLVPDVISFAFEHFDSYWKKLVTIYYLITYDTFLTDAYNIYYI